MAKTCVAASVPGWMWMVRRSTILSDAAVMVSTPTLYVPDATAPSILASNSASNAANSVFWRSIVSANSRLRNWVIGGSSSLSVPSRSVSVRPVASSKRLSVQPSTLPA